MQSMYLRICLFLALCLAPLEGLRILVSFPMASPSHNILGNGVVNNLLRAGHEVVYLTAYPRPKPVANLTEIDCSPLGETLREEAEKSDHFKLKHMIKQTTISPEIIAYIMYEYNKELLQYEPLQKLLRDPKEKFDLAIIEWFFSEAIAGIPALFNCPFIWVCSTEAHGQILSLVDEFSNPAYSADLFSSNSLPFSFGERVEELYFYIKRQLINLILKPFEERLYNRVFPEIAAKRGVTVPSYYDAVYNASLILVNSHPSVGTPFKLPQSVKYIGGYHIDRNVKPLPEDLQKLMDQSKHGVIYFSMGSNMKSTDMSEEMKASLLKMFGKFKQDVIWKFEDTMDNVPSNVHLMKWAPQPSILAHPNLKLFITHGGQLSTTEAVHFGVPVVGIPIFGDQHINMRSVVHKGFGVMVQISEDFTDELKAAIEKVLDPAYSIKAKQLSMIYHDRLATPGDELVYWAEHVVKSVGASHLKSPALNVPWYQKIYLDLIALTTLILSFLYKSLKIVWRMCRSGRKKQKKH